MTATRFPIEAGHIMCFARAIGDFNPVYHDEAQAALSETGGIIAPPTFVEASSQYDLDNPSRPKPGEPWRGSGRTPTGRVPTSEDATQSDDSRDPTTGTDLHAEQHFEYFRPIRPGEVLAVTSSPGNTWQKQGRRGGLLTFVETIDEFRGEDDELVLTRRFVAVRTTKVVERTPRMEEN